MLGSRRIEGHSFWHLFLSELYPLFSFSFSLVPYPCKTLHMMISRDHRGDLNDLQRRQQFIFC